MASDDQAPVVLEQEIVTARKRSESLQNIPVAATAVTTEKLDNYGLRSTEAIAASIPAAQYRSRPFRVGCDDQPARQTYAPIGIEQSVAVNLDGVYYGQGRIINEGFFDMKQVEILRGPRAPRVCLSQGEVQV